MVRRFFVKIQHQAIMKKIYIAPNVEYLHLDFESIVATSGGLNNGDNVGNRLPIGDDDDNFFSNARGEREDEE